MMERISLAEVVDLAVNAHEMKLAKVCDGES